MRKHTDGDRIHVIVIDNNSRDGSVEYLRTLRWIQLIERVPATDESEPLSHARALDEGLPCVSTPYALSIHTDTLITQAGWLDALLRPMKEHENVAGVGSWKLDNDTFIKHPGKKVQTTLKEMLTLPAQNSGDREGAHGNDHYLRSHCAIYRTDFLLKHGLRFSEHGDSMPAGKMIHRMLIAHGYKTVFLSPESFKRYLCTSIMPR